MSTEIYYFSGTGNSLHVAKEVQKRIPETKLIPLISLLDKDIIETKGDTIGFVFPIHFATLPMIVKSISEYSPSYANAKSRGLPDSTTIAS